MQDEQRDVPVDPDALLVLSKSERRRRARQKALPTWGETAAQTVARRTRRIKELAMEAGFSRVGLARAEPLHDDLAALQRWLAAGMHGSMAWMAEDPQRRCDPRQVVPGARTVIALAVDYDTAEPHTSDVALGPDRAWISRYAWGDDYHLVLERRLKGLEAAVVAELGPELADDFRGPDVPAGPFRGIRDFRRYVDHGPVLERAWAERAGLGWRGKHTLLVDPHRGSWFFLACVVTTLELLADAPQTDHCGSCTACLDACPTAAIVAPRVVDARRCISHATIEVEGLIPNDLRGLVGDQLFGCDICQDVCPFNRFSSPCGDPAFSPRPGLLAPQLSQFETLTQETMDGALAGSPLRRRGLAGLRDNAAAIRALRRDP